MTEREFVVTRVSENGSIVIIVDEKELVGLSPPEVKTILINKAIKDDMWEKDQYECDDTLGITYEVNEQ